jgi:hypothetical protein
MNAKTIVVAPFNIVSSLPPELEGSTKMVSSALVDHIEAHGKTVRVIDFRSGRKLWVDSMKEVRESGAKRNFENAARVYARRIGEQIEFDALIVPSIFIQNAQSRSGWAYWDNAKKKIKITGDSPKGGVLALGSHYFKAASAFVYVLDREGGAIQSSRYGLELLQHVNFKSTDEFFIVDNVPLMKNGEDMRDGIAKALSPFLPEDTPIPAANDLDVSPDAEDTTDSNPS